MLAILNFIKMDYLLYHYIILLYVYIIAINCVKPNPNIYLKYIIYILEKVVYSFNLYCYNFIYKD